VAPGADQGEDGRLTGTAPDTVSRNAGFAFASKLVGVVFSAALTIVIVRVLGPDDYGTYALALSIAGLLILPSDIGVSQAAARFVAESLGDRSRVARVISDAYRAKILAAGAVSVALFLLATPVANAYGTPALVWPLRILAVSLFAESFFFLYNALFTGLGRISSYLRIATAESFTEASLAIPIVLLGGGAAGAVAGRAAAYVIAVLYGAILLRRSVGGGITLRSGGEESRMRHIFGYGSALLVIEGAFTIFSRLDAILIGAIISVEAVGQFGAAIQVAAILGIGGAAVGAAVTPRMANSDESPSDVKILERSLPWVIMLQGLFLAPAVVWADPITKLILGGGFGEAADTLRVLAPFAFLGGISPIAAGSVNYLGEARRRIPIAIGAVLINAAIDVALLGKIGVVAAAIGTDVAYGVYVIAHFSILRRMAGLGIRPLLVALGKTLVAATATAALLVALGTGEVALPILIVGAVTAPCVYLAALVAVRAVDVATLRQAGGGIRAALRPARS
jgi:O-antigen/teichoic acid export membrane protein